MIVSCTRRGRSPGGRSGAWPSPARAQTTGPQRWHRAHSTRRARGRACRRSDSAGPRAGRVLLEPRSSCPGAQRGWAAARAPRPDRRVRARGALKPICRQPTGGPVHFFEEHPTTLYAPTSRKTRARAHAAAAPAARAASRSARPAQRVPVDALVLLVAAAVARTSRKRSFGTAKTSSCAFLATRLLCSRCGPSASTVRAAVCRRAAWRGGSRDWQGCHFTPMSCRRPCRSARWRPRNAARLVARVLTTPIECACGSARAVVRALPLYWHGVPSSSSPCTVPDDADVVPVGLSAAALWSWPRTRSAAVPSAALVILGAGGGDDGRDPPWWRAISSAYCRAMLRQPVTALASQRRAQA